MLERLLNRWSGVLLGAAAAAVYVAGASRTIFVGDSGELVAAVDTLGIAHPSGYPLYVLLGKAWTVLVPLGSIAFRMSLFSALFAGITVGLTHRIARVLGLSTLAAIIASLLVAFSPSLWGEANIQRVYTLNAAFVAGGALAAVTWWRTRNDRHLLAAFFVCALGATNHTFMVFEAVAIAIFASTVDPGLVRNARLIGTAAGVTAAGLIPYAYLPIRSAMDPALDWGDPETLRSFVDVVIRRDFWPRAWLESPGDLVEVVVDYVGSLGFEAMWAGGLLAIAGAVYGLRRGLPVLLLGLVMFVNVATMALHGSRADLFIWHRYYIPSYVMLALLAGIGVHALQQRWRRLAPATLIVPLAALAVGYAQFDRSDYKIAEDFGRLVLESMPEGATLLASDDNVLFTLMYLHHVENERPDVLLVPQGADAELPELRFDPDQDDIYFTHHPNWEIEGLEVVPVGLVFKAVRSGTPVPPALIPSRPLDGERDADVPKEYLTQNLIGHFHYMKATSLIDRNWNDAVGEMRAAALAAPDDNVLFYNLGLVLVRNGLFPEALAAFERSATINPRALTGTTARAADRIAEARVEMARVQSVVARLVRSRSETGSIPVDEIARKLRRRGEAVAAHGFAVRAIVPPETFEALERALRAG